jgi:hypothetical protein
VPSILILNGVLRHPEMHWVFNSPLPERRTVCYRPHDCRTSWFLKPHVWTSHILILVTSPQLCSLLFHQNERLANMSLTPGFVCIQGDRTWAGLRSMAGWSFPHSLHKEIAPSVISIVAVWKRWSLLASTFQNIVLGSGLESIHWLVHCAHWEFHFDQIRISCLCAFKLLFPQFLHSITYRCYSKRCRLSRPNGDPLKPLRSPRGQTYSHKNMKVLHTFVTVLMF